jgi:uncharacterized RDD family membrane protein YckC
VIAAVVGFPFISDVLGAARTYVDAVQRSVENQGPRPDPFSMYTDPQFVSGYSGFLVVSVIVTGLYFVPLTALRGATLGKMAVGVRVRPLASEGRPSWSRSTIRWALRDVVGNLPLVGGAYGLVDALWLLWDERRQCLHDKPAGTVVVDARARPLS